MWLDFDVRDNRRCTFSLRKSYYGLWNHILVQNVLMLDLFHLLSSQDINWWTGVVWIIVIFLSAVWTLILTAPIHCRASIAETLMQRHISTNLMKKQTHPNLIDGLMMRTFSADFHVFYKLFAHLHQPTEPKLVYWLSVSQSQVQKSKTRLLDLLTLGLFFFF